LGLGHARSSPVDSEEISAPANVILDEDLAVATVQDRLADIQLYHRHVSSVHAYFSWRFGRDLIDEASVELITHASRIRADSVIVQTGPK
ncbi:MAG: hypothetical protein HY678_06530, partial [Chloroflexi bacterium]|nr:hypothetical protein [Chloroflexota bacterium]